MGRQRHLAVLTIVLGIALSTLDATSITLVLPTMTRELGVGADDAIWIINGFQLAVLAALLPLANWGERFTYRRVYLVGVSLWGAASAVVCVVDSLPLLIAARVAQGLGAAGLMAVNMALVRLTWPPALLGRGVALNSVVVSTATVIGPLVAAAVLSVGSWRWLFGLNIAACLALLVLGRRTLPVNTPASQAHAPTWLDIALNAGMFVLLFLAADSLGRALAAAGDGSPGLILGAALLLAGVVVTAVHVRRQWRQPRALLPLDLLRIPVFRLSMMTSIGSFSAQTMAYITLPFLLFEIWRASAGQAGLFMACWPVGTMVAASLTSRLIGRYHSGTLGALGLAALALGLAGLAQTALAPQAGMAVTLSLVLCGLGFGLFQSPNNHTIITSGPAARAGAASGMLGTARLTGQTIGATLTALVFSLHGASTPAGLSLALWIAAALATAAGMASAARTRS